MVQCSRRLLNNGKETDLLFLVHENKEWVQNNYERE